MPWRIKLLGLASLVFFLFLAQFLLIRYLSLSSHLAARHVDQSGVENVMQADFKDMENPMHIFSKRNELKNCEILSLAQAYTSKWRALYRQGVFFTSTKDRKWRVTRNRTADEATHRGEERYFLVVFNEGRTHKRTAPAFGSMQYVGEYVEIETSRVGEYVEIETSRVGVHIENIRTHTPSLSLSPSLSLPLSLSLSISFSLSLSFAIRSQAFDDKKFSFLNVTREQVMFNLGYASVHLTAPSPALLCSSFTPPGRTQSVGCSSVESGSERDLHPTLC